MKNTDVKSDQKAKPGSLQRFSLGITFIINLSELENSSVNLFEEPCLVHWLFVHAKPSDACLQSCSDLHREVIAQLVPRFRDPNRLRDDDLCSNVPVTPAAANPLNALVAEFLKLSISPDGERVMVDCWCVRVAAVL